MALTRDEVRAAIHFQNPPRPPMAFIKWWGEGLWEQYGEKLRQFDAIEEDVDVIGFPVPAYTTWEDGFYLCAIKKSKYDCYRWTMKGKKKNDDQ